MQQEKLNACAEIVPTLNRCNISRNSSLTKRWTVKWVFSEIPQCVRRLVLHMPTYRLVESANAFAQVLTRFKMCFLNVLRLHVSQTQRQKRLYKQYMEQLAGAYVERCTDLNTMHWDPRYTFRVGTPDWRYSMSCDEGSYGSEGSRSCWCSECDSGRCSSPCCSEVIFNGGQHISGKIVSQHVCRRYPVCYPGHFG